MFLIQIINYYHLSQKQQSSSLESQGKHNFKASSNNNFYNKENISQQHQQQYIMHQINGICQQTQLQQQQQPQLQQQQYIQQQVHMNKLTPITSINIHPNSRRFGQDLSNYQQTSQGMNPPQPHISKKNNGSLNNSRCTSRELSVNNRRQNNFISQQQGNNNKLNNSVNMIVEKSGGASNNSRFRAGTQQSRTNQVNNINSNLKMDVENCNSNNVSYQNFCTENSNYFPAPSSTQMNSQFYCSVSGHNNSVNYHSQSQTDYTTEYFNYLSQHGSIAPQSQYDSNQSNISFTQNTQQNKQILSQVPQQQNQISKQKCNSRKNNSDNRSSMEQVDLKCIDKPEYVPQYAKEIFEYLRSNEDKHICKTQYFEQGSQPDLNSRMRTILIDWLIDVHLKFDLLPETLFLAVNLIDRFLEKGPKIEKSKFQLVGIAALFIACKYEEIYPPEVKDFTYVCDNAYTKQELFEYEGLILQTLSFNITTPSAFRFLERYARIAEFDQKQFLTSLYFLEMSLVDYQGIKYTPSQLACGSILISNIIFNKTERWNEALIRNTKYEQQQLIPVVEEICEIHRKFEQREKQTQDKDKQLNAVKRKFNQQRFEFVYNNVIQFFSSTSKTVQATQQQSSINNNSSTNSN